MAGIVRTVLGDVGVDSLGNTLIHEHLLSSLVPYWDPSHAREISVLDVQVANLAAIRQHAFAVRDNLVLDSLEMSIRELRRFRDAGGGTLVEVTSHGIGRDVRGLVEISAAAGVHIVAGCGYYIGDTHPYGFGSRGELSLAEELIQELTEGVSGTPAMAGIIGELGVGTYPMSEAERLMLRAAASAQRVSGAGMVVHAAPGLESPFEIARVLGDAGAIMGKVVVSHLDERFRNDLELFVRLAESGCKFGLDTFGREIYYDSRRRQHPSDAERIMLVRNLLSAGLGGHITLAHDICLKHELASFGGHGYGHIFSDILPRLGEAGVTESDIHQMIFANPAAVLVLEPVGMNKGIWSSLTSRPGPAACLSAPTVPVAACAPAIAATDARLQDASALRSGSTASGAVREDYGWKAARSVLAGAVLVDALGDQSSAVPSDSRGLDACEDSTRSDAQ